MSECYFYVKAVYGVTEECFKIEARKSPSLILFYYWYKAKLTLHGLTLLT